MRSASLVILSLLLGCTGAPDLLTELPEPFTHATAMRDCAPWDGPAVSIVLTEGPLDSTGVAGVPALYLSIWRGLDAIHDASFMWPADEAIATASWCESGEACEPALGGMIRIASVGEDSTVTGEFEVTFRDGVPVSGGFQAVWRDRVLLCG